MPLARAAAIGRVTVMVTADGYAADPADRERGRAGGRAGGQISNDMIDGYGPDEYAIRLAPAGAYGVRINGYDADRINPDGPGHVLIRLQRNFGRGSATQELVDADLTFQTDRNRNDETRTKPVATLQVQQGAASAGVDRR